MTDVRVLGYGALLVAGLVGGFFLKPVLEPDEVDIRPLFTPTTTYRPNEVSPPGRTITIQPSATVTVWRTR